MLKNKRQEVIFEKSMILNTIIKSETPLNAKQISKIVYSTDDDNFYKKTLRLIKSIEEEHPILYSLINTNKKSKEIVFQNNFKNFINYKDLEVKLDLPNKIILELFNTKDNDNSEDKQNKIIKTIDFAIASNYYIEIDRIIKGNNLKQNVLPIYFFKNEKRLITLIDNKNDMNIKEDIKKIKSIIIDDDICNIVIDKINDNKEYDNFKLIINNPNDQQSLVRSFTIENNYLEFNFKHDSFNNICLDDRLPKKVIIKLNSHKHFKIFTNKYPKSKYNYKIVNDNEIHLELYYTKKLMAFYIESLLDIKNEITIDGKNPIDVSLINKENTED